MKRIAFLSVVALLLSACSGASSSGTSTAPSFPSAPVSSSASPEPTSSASATGLDKGVEMTVDPVGDPSPAVPGYLDAFGAGVAEGWGDFVFVFEVAEPIPSAFDVPQGYDAALWSFCLDTDPSSAPAGYPFVSMGAVPCDFIVLGTSEGGEVTGILIDRRPLAAGKDALTRPIRVFTDGSQGRSVVPDKWLGGRHTAFDWVMATSLISLPFPNDEFIDLDEIVGRWKG